MNLDSVPPVRPLLTHVIADEPLRREAGVSGLVVQENRVRGMEEIARSEGANTSGTNAQVKRGTSHKPVQLSYPGLAGAREKSRRKRKRRESIAVLYCKVSGAG